MPVDPYHIGIQMKRKGLTKTFMMILINPFTTIHDRNFRRHSSMYVIIHDGNFRRHVMADKMITICTEMVLDVTLQ